MASPTKSPEETDRDIKRAVTINEAAIEQEFIELPATLSRWCFRRVEATKALRYAELNLETEEAQVRLKVQSANEAAVASGPRDAKTGKSKLKGATVAEIDTLVVVSPSVRQAKERVIEATEAKERAQAMVDAIHEKSTMLVSLGATLRLAMEREPTIRDRRR